MRTGWPIRPRPGPTRPVRCVVFADRAETCATRTSVSWAAASLTEALKAGLVDEVVLHQVPVLLGGGRPFFQALPEHVRLRLVEAVPAPGVTHLHYEVAR